MNTKISAFGFRINVLTGNEHGQYSQMHAHGFSYKWTQMLKTIPVTTRQWNEVERCTHHNLKHWIKFRSCGKRQLYLEAFFFNRMHYEEKCLRKLSHFILWLKAFYPSFIPGLNKVQWGIKLPVLNYSLYFQIECTHGMFLKPGGGSVIHGKFKACWVNNLLSHSNNFQLKFLDPNKGKQDHSVILQQFRESKRNRWEKERHL